MNNDNHNDNGERSCEPWRTKNHNDHGEQRERSCEPWRTTKRRRLPDSALRCVHSQYRDFRYIKPDSTKPDIHLFCNIRGKSIRRNQETCALTCPYYQREVGIRDKNRNPRSIRQ